MVERAIRNKLFRGFSSFESIRPKTEIFDIELVKQDLLNHFHTSRGERVMRPDFGSIIWDLLFEPFDQDLKDAVVADVQNVIDQEPRVTLRTVDVIEFEHGLRINISVIYNPLDVVGTFELEFDRRNQISGTEFAETLQ